MKKLLILLILLLTGCNKYTELNELAIIKSIGIEKKEDYTLYALIITDIKDNEPVTEIIKVSDNNLNNLFNKIKLQVNKEIYFSHIDLIILDFNLNNNDYDNLIKYFLNHHEFRNDFLTILSSDMKNVLDNSRYDEIENLIITNKESKTVIKKTFEKIMQEYLDNKEFTISNITYQDKIMFDGNYQYKDNELKEIK